jgi:hypothetical protein
MPERRTKGYLLCSPMFLPWPTVVPEDGHGSRMERRLTVQQTVRYYCTICRCPPALPRGFQVEPPHAGRKSSEWWMLAGLRARERCVGTRSYNPRLPKSKAFSADNGVRSQLPLRGSPRIALGSLLCPEPRFQSTNTGAILNRPLGLVKQSGEDKPRRRGTVR